MLVGRWWWWAVVALADTIPRRASATSAKTEKFTASSCNMKLKGMLPELPELTLRGFEWRNNFRKA